MPFYDISSFKYIKGSYRTDLKAFLEEVNCSKHDKRNSLKSILKSVIARAYIFHKSTNSYFLIKQTTESTHRNDCFVEYMRKFSTVVYTS